MVNWSDIVSGRTVNSFVTINSKSYAYKNNVTLNAGPAINVIGNPAAFFSGTAVLTSNINDGRTRNALRMFIYNALRADDDYTDAQAATYGNTASTDEFLVIRTDGHAALTGSAPWPVHSTIVSGDRAAANSSSTHRLQLVAIRDRNGHARVWRARSGLTATTAASFATAYDKLTDEQVREEFGLPAPSTPGAKDFSALTTADKADFYEYTIPPSAGAFYGNPTNMYAAGTKVFNGTNKSASMNGWMVGHIQTLVRSLNNHWCGTSDNGMQILLKTEGFNGVGDTRRWDACGETRGTGDGNFGQAARITDIVIQSSDGKAHYYKREAADGATTFATANYVEQLSDARFYVQSSTTPDMPRPSTGTRGGGGMHPQILAWLVQDMKKRDKDKKS